MLKSVSIILTFVVAFSFTSAQVTGLAGWDIFVDPGHSQNENMGVYNYSEAMKNLGVGLHLRDLLLNNTDIDTVLMSRTNAQQYIGLAERCYLANDLGASWYHSLHSDAGSSTYNSTLLLWGELYNGQPDPPIGGEEMSGYMVDLLTRGMRTTTRGSIGDCSFYTWSNWCQTSGGPYLAVNRLTYMPSELSEAGFHTNPRQNQLNMNAEWKRLEAWTFFWSILEYHDIARPPVGIITGIISNLESGRTINGATVSVDGQTYMTDTYDSLFYQYSTDPDQLSNGFYYFEGLPDSVFELVVEADGFYSDTQMVSIIDTFFTFRDVELLSSTPPRIVESTPAKGDSAYPAWEYIILDFSRGMDRPTTENAFSILPEATGYFAWSGDNRRLVFVPDSLAFTTDYTVTIADSAVDLYGHALDGDHDGVAGGDFVLTFRTSGSDIIAPEIVDIYPPVSSNQIELQPIINIVYNEIVGPADQLSTYFTIERFADHTLVDNIFENYTVNDRTVVSLFPSAKLYPDEVYVTRIEPGIYDSHGNTINEAGAYSFLTAATDIDIRTISPLENNLTSNWWQPLQSGSSDGLVPDSVNMAANSDIVNHTTGSTKSMEITYGWDVAANNWLLREYLSGGAPRNVIFNTDYTLQVYIFGDGSGNQFRFALDEGTSSSWPNHEVSQWFTIDWYGWKLIEWDLSDPAQVGSWIGNGALDGSRYRFDSIQLTHTTEGAVFGRLYFDDLRLVTPVIVGIEPQLAQLPQEFHLEQNFPNPFNPETTIEYSVRQAGSVHLAIYNLKGQLVRSLVKEEIPAGTHRITWDGRDSRGNQAASGVYIYRLTSDSQNLSRRMLLIR